MTSSGRAPSGGAVERLLRRDHVIVAAAAAALVLLAALYTVAGAGMDMTAFEMTRMAGPIGSPMPMGGAPVWTPGYAVLVVLMWWVMMIAMMTPGAAPTLLLYTSVKRMGPEAARAAVLSGAFLAGYLVAWAGFSAVATTLQYLLQAAGLSDGAMMTIRSRGFAGAVLIAAGAYQFTGWKDACLSQCRSPAQFLAAHHRPGAAGACRMGIDHGIYCVGCCWALMALLFVGGIMNLYWIVGIALYVLAEKMLPFGSWTPRLSGGALVLLGSFLVLA